MSLAGHTAAVPFIYHAEVLSKPHDGNSYKAGDRIDLFFRGLVMSTKQISLRKPTFWLGSGAEHRRSARFVGSALFSVSTYVNLLV